MTSLVVVDQLRIVCTAVVELPFCAVGSAAHWRKKTESGCRVSEQHISAVLINSADRSSKTNLLTKELPHCERFGLVLHHETNLVI